MAGISLEHLVRGLYPECEVENAGKDAVKVRLPAHDEKYLIKMTQAGGKTTLTADNGGTRVLTKAEVNAAVQKGAKA